MLCRPLNSDEMYKNPLAGDYKVWPLFKVNKLDAMKSNMAVGRKKDESKMIEGRRFMSQQTTFAFLTFYETCITQGNPIK